MENRFERGLAKLKEIDGAQGERVVESLKDIAPDFARYVIEFAFGDIYATWPRSKVTGDWNGCCTDRARQCHSAIEGAHSCGT